MTELRRSGVLVAAYNVPPVALEHMKKYMTYSRREMSPDGRGGLAFSSTPVRLWDQQADGSLVFPCGFVPRVCGIHQMLGLEVTEYQRLDRPRDLKYDLSGVDVAGARPEQLKMLEALALNEGGQIISPTGSGKSYGIRELCCMYPSAKIVIAAPGQETVGTLRRYLGEKFGDSNVGQCGGGKRHTRRITVTTFDSILKVDSLESVDVLLVDEGHRTPASKYEKNMMAIASPIKRFMFTATPEGRADGAELVMEALFGPELVRVEFQDSVSSGSILPVMLVVRDQPFGPGEDILKRTQPGPRRDRVAIWRNTLRNQMIARDVYEAISQFNDPQVLVLVDKTEHALVLKEYLPDFTLVCGSLDAKRRSKLEKAGVLDEEDDMMTPKEREAARIKFEKGELRRVLATQVFATGVSADQCQVVAIAGGTGSTIQFIQSAGRGTRKCDSLGKTHAVVLLWHDLFFDGYARRSAKLVAAARNTGYHVVRVPCQ